MPFLCDAEVGDGLGSSRFSTPPALGFPRSPSSGTTDAVQVCGTLTGYSGGGGVSGRRSRIGSASPSFPCQETCPAGGGHGLRAERLFRPGKERLRQHGAFADTKGFVFPPWQDNLTLVCRAAWREGSQRGGSYPKLPLIRPVHCFSCRIFSFQAMETASGFIS